MMKLPSKYRPIIGLILGLLAEHDEIVDFMAMLVGTHESMNQPSPEDFLLLFESAIALLIKKGWMIGYQIRGDTNRDLADSWLTGPAPDFSVLVRYDGRTWRPRVATTALPSFQITREGTKIVKHAAD